MPTPRHEVYCTNLLDRLTVLAKDPDHRDQIEHYAEAAEVLLLLDLEPARARLEAGLAPNPRGGEPRDMVVVWRVMLLGLLIGEPRYNALVRIMRSCRVLRVIAGLEDDDRGPGVGTLYDFENRLYDGAYRAPCAHRERPSVTQRRRAAAPQPKRESATSAKKKGRVPTTSPRTAADTVAQLQARADQTLPDTLATRLNELLHLVAVVPSAKLGLLGQLDQMRVAGDSSVLPTGAAFHGKKTCAHTRFERCECDRIYADPDATLGFDSHANTVFYGHRFYEFSLIGGGHDLPLAIDIDTGNTSDAVAGPLVTEILVKTLANTLPEAAVKIGVFDAGHDAEAFHVYLGTLGIDPVIPVKIAVSPRHPTRPELTLSQRGVPLCPANIEMAPAGSAGVGTKAFTCALRAGRVRVCPLAPDGDTTWHCRPDLKAGPSVTIAIADNPRLVPRIARNSAAYTRHYKSRTCTERSNAIKKTRFKLVAARRRRASGWRIVLANMAILQHALAWAQDAGEQGSIRSLLSRNGRAAA